jgi:SnoaL-like polyketide cyclase
LASWFAAFPNARVEVEAVHIVDDVAVEEGTFTGTQNGVLHGPMGDIPPTGRSVEVDYIQVLRFRDGKHVSFNLMFDRLTMLEQLGLVPTSAAAAWCSSPCRNAPSTARRPHQQRSLVNIAYRRLPTRLQPSSGLHLLRCMSLLSAGMPQ